MSKKNKQEGPVGIPKNKIGVFMGGRTNPTPSKPSFLKPTVKKGQK